MSYRHLVLTAVVCTVPAAHAQNVTHEESWTETHAMRSSSPVITVDNVWGNVSIVAGDTDVVTLNVHELRSAPDQRRMNAFREAMALNVDTGGGGFSAVVGDREERWQRFESCRGCRVDYQLELVVPPDSVVHAHTVMDGRVTVRGVRGALTASNVNGPVDVSGLRACQSIESVNGDVTVVFDSQPAQECRFETVNGDITLGLPSGVGLDAAIDLFNGRVLSEMEVSPLSIPAKVETSQEDGGFRYRIEQPLGLRLLSGGPRLSLSSLNGNIVLKNNPYVGD